MDICKVYRYIFAFSLVISLYLIQAPENVVARKKKLDDDSGMMDEVLVDESDQMDTYDIIRGQNRRTQRGSGKQNMKIMTTLAALATAVLIVVTVVKYRQTAIDTLSGMMKGKDKEEEAKKAKKAAVVVMPPLPLPPVALPWHKTALYAMVRWGNKLATLTGLSVSGATMYALYTGAILSTIPMVIPVMITISIIAGLLVKLLMTINVPGVRKNTALLLTAVLMVVGAGFATQHYMGQEVFAGHYNTAVSKSSDLYESVYQRVFGAPTEVVADEASKDVDTDGTSEVTKEPKSTATPAKQGDQRQKTTPPPPKPVSSEKGSDGESVRDLLTGRGNEPTNPTSPAQTDADRLAALELSKALQEDPSQAQAEVDRLLNQKLNEARQADLDLNSGLIQGGPESNEVVGQTGDGTGQTDTQVTSNPPSKEDTLPTEEQGGADPNGLSKEVNELDPTQTTDQDTQDTLEVHEPTPEELLEQQRLKDLELSKNEAAPLDENDGKEEEGTGNAELTDEQKLQEAERKAAAAKAAAMEEEHEEVEEHTEEVEEHTEEVEEHTEEAEEHTEEVEEEEQPAGGEPDEEEGPAVDDKLLALDTDQSDNDTTVIT